MRILALDLGAKRVGVAISDETFTIARPLQFIAAEKLMEGLQELRTEYEFNKILLGLPISMDGKEHQQAQDIRKQAESLKALENIELEFVDERLTSVQANRFLDKLQVKDKKNEKDSLSAQILLQNYLNNL